MSPIGGKPLFDLIANRRPGGDTPTPEPPTERAGPTELGSKTVTLPMVWVYAGVGLILLIVFAGYGIGYKLGTASTRDAERRAATQDAERVFVDDPLQSRTPSRLPDDEQASAARPAPSGDAGPQRTQTGVTVYLGDGRLGPDPRRAGVNYLELVTLPRSQATEAVRYLSGSGEEAIAVPVSELDPRRRASNTSDSFRVIALGLAVPGDRFSSSADARRRFEIRIARLGKAWAADGGASDFSDPLWRRFGG